MTNSRKAALSALVLALIAACGKKVDTPLERAQRAYDRRDYGLALQLLRPLAEQGDVKAQFNLGLIYYNGLDVAQDYAEAMKWYHKAADQDHAGAQHNLGLMYWGGKGVPQDYVQAHKWFSLAAAHDSASETASREIAVGARDAVAAKMTPAQIDEAQGLVREWKPR